MICLTCNDLSVIVPSYNCQRYIERCVESILMCEPLEVILVNDASTDDTRKVCEQLSNRHKNVIVVNHLVNGGVVKSRYDGLEISRGKYIAYIDADDWINPDFLKFAQTEFQKDEKVDIVVGKMCMDNESGLVCPISLLDEFVILEHTEALRELFRWNYYRWELCGKIYKKALFNGWKTDETVKVCEDLDCTWELFQRARKTACIPRDYYHYFFNENSVSYNFKYIESNIYKVFEKILNNPVELDNDTLAIVIRHYKGVLINIIRESLLFGNKEELIKFFQHKYWKLLQKFQLKADVYEKDIFTSPDSVTTVFEKIRTQLLTICNTASKGEIFLYGTGIVSAFFTEILNRESVEIDGYVISDGQYKRSTFCNNKVYYLTEISCDCVLVMAVNEKMQDLIMRNLEEKGYWKVYRMNCFGLV